MRFFSSIDSSLIFPLVYVLCRSASKAVDAENLYHGISVPYGVLINRDGTFSAHAAYLGEHVTCKSEGKARSLLIARIQNVLHSLLHGGYAWSPGDSLQTSDIVPAAAVADSNTAGTLGIKTAVLFL